MWKRWRIRILLFLAVLGPGFITANVDNDSGGIFTYSQAGAQYGYTLLWTMIPITIALIVVQEMCSRMGVVTGKGLSDLIREEFGLRITFVLMVLLVVVNYTNVVTEFIGIAGSLHLFHVTKFISVPICAFLVWALVLRGDYKSTEKIFLIASLVYIAYIFAGMLSPSPTGTKPCVATVKLPPSARSGATSLHLHGHRRGGHHHRPVDAVLPAVVDRGEGNSRQGLRRLASRRHRGLLLHRHRSPGSSSWPAPPRSSCTAWAPSRWPPTPPKPCARWPATTPSSSSPSASSTPRCSRPPSCRFPRPTPCARAWASSRAWTRASAKRPSSTGSIRCSSSGGALTVLLLPDAQLINVAILSQVLNGVLLPVVIILMLLLINRTDLMGEYKNSRLWNGIAWGTSIIVIGMTLVMLWGMMPGH